MKEEFITTKQAAELAGVTTNTIQNLCRAKAIRHRRQGKMYFVSREDIEKYVDKINTIYEAEEDIAKLEEQILNRKVELLNAEEDLRFRVVQIHMFPQRVNAIFEVLYAALCHYEPQWQDSALTEREVQMLKDGLKGKTLDKMGEESCVTKECVRQKWHKALRKYAFTKNEIARRDDIIAELKECIREQNKKIYAYEHTKLPPTIADCQEEDIEIAKQLITNVKDIDLSVRSYNCLKAAEIETLYDLVTYHREDLLRWRNFGRKSLRELDELLGQRGLAFGMPTAKYEQIMLELKTKITN